MHIQGITAALALALGALGQLPSAHSSANARDLALGEIAAAKDSPLTQFRRWAHKHERQYLEDEAEFARRFEVWLDNVNFVHEYNSKHESHWLSLNAHADQTQEEFQQQRLGFDYAAFKARRAERLRSGEFSYADVDSADLPDEIDWRARGAVTGVKNQKRCGSCWAFSTTGAIEGVNAIYTGTLEVLSEQELVDCDTRHDHGCHGGLMDTAFEFVISNGGIDTEEDYRYHAVEGQCSINRENRHVVTIDDYDDVPHEDEGALRKAVAHQPIATAIQANQRSFQLYGGGVFTEECGTALNHGVLIVGYGVENGTDYWLIKNSWGEFWGDSGYIKLERTSENGPGKCGLAIAPSYPIKNHDNPPRPPKPAPDPSPSPTPSPPPGPSPPSPKPVVCDATTQCYPGTTCCCMEQISNMCLEWACCPIPDATCCQDHVHCCPHDLPVCDVDHGRCLPKGARQAGGSSSGGVAGGDSDLGRSAHDVWRQGLLGATESSVPIMKKLPAERRRSADEVLQQTQ